ncbi:hypothetical protein [Chamaesiphon polymorphus]|nr:hypothetical protein [Chamaesiphon polymorphus]
MSCEWTGNLVRSLLCGMAIVFGLAPGALAGQSPPTNSSSAPPVAVTGKQTEIVPVVNSPSPAHLSGKTIAPTPPLPLPSVLRETPNNPLAAPPDIDELLKVRMSEDIWVAMYSPLVCLDTTPNCIAKLQQAAVQNSPVIKELEVKVATVNQKIAAAKTNNQQSLELSIFEPALQVFLQRETVVENGQSRKLGFGERVGQLFSNPGEVLGELLGAIGIPLLRGLYGGNDAQRSRAIQITDLTVKVAEMERIKTELAAKTREKVQQLILDFDVLAREFQAEQAIAQTETRSFKLYAITYAAGDGDTHTYLNRKEKLDRTKLQVFKNWARVRNQITAIKSVVLPQMRGG